ncbi:Metallophos domain-containing protein [Trichostrongylus colubriformis]|uniref:Metallophos domain-containing protein n=1 Tax=Trichostrongylus colubriformis TaxID=6319 RepID=A0AAN8G668_TRICO
MAISKIVFIFALLIHTTVMAKVDPNSEEDYWETIKAEKVQIPVQINSLGEINSPPSGPHLKVVCISDTHNQLDLVKIDGVTFYGSSWHPLYGYPFYRPRPLLEEKWKKLPSNLDVLITHTPALGYLDTFTETEPERWGCRYLLKEIETRVKPKFHVFGHVHQGYGALSNGNTTFINAAQASKKNKITNKPLVFYIPKK